MVSIECCHVLRFDADGPIVAQDIYEDHLTVLQQLGVL
jgi:hypothetical protein